jgi:hypothetical protein
MKCAWTMLAALSVSAALSADAFRYSDEPLKQKPLMTTAEVAVEVTRFNNWLVDNQAAIPKDKVAGTREHVYLLIDSILKGQRAEDRSTFNDFETFALNTLFNWATEFNVYGAGLVALHFAGSADVPLAEPLLPSDQFELRLEFPYFLVSSRQSPWRLQFPYYFMIWEAKRFTATSGLVTDLVIASTSFANHKQGGGRSQATLMFMFSPDADCAVFDQFWLDQLSIGAGHKTKESLLPRSRNYAIYDRGQRMRKEVTLLSDYAGCTAFALLGIDGTFQANRISYLDFMRSVSRSTETSNNRMNPPAGDGFGTSARPCSPAAGYADST